MAAGIGTNGIDAIPDPDDSGSDTSQRYRYQAEAAFGACLDLALRGTVLSVIPERFEDLLIEEQERWRFVQVKTRDPGLNPFSFSDLLGEKGALRSVARTHEAILDFEDGREIRYEIWLERGARNRNEIQRLMLPERTGPDEGMVALCAKRLDVEVAFAQTMLDRCFIRAPLPSRDLIRDSNIRNLQRFNSTIAVTTTEEIYESVIALIETVMRAELLKDDFPACVLQPDGVEEALAQKVAAKRIDGAMVGELFEPLKGGNAAVLEQITDPEQLTASELERKLLAAGVSDATRRDAKLLRANATRRVYELGTGLTDPDALFADLDARALVVADATAGTIGDSPPGPAVYSALLDRLGDKPELVDPRGLLDQDAMFLLGRVCDLSDRCLFAWGAD